MKKLITLALALTLTLALTACGGSDTSSGDTSEVPDAPTANLFSDIDDGSGIYEGELDTNGNFTGWGIWIYHNFRYEGYFVDGVPNGEGTLYEAKEVENIQGESDDPSERVVYGQWINGQGNGLMIIKDVHKGYTNVWEIEAVDGLSTVDGRIEGVCSGPEVDTQPVYWPISEGRKLAQVPPWSYPGSGLNTLSAPAGSGTNISPTHGQTQSPDSSEFTTPDAASVDISKLVFNADATSLIAQINGDGTVTYTYKDTSLKPSYSSDTEVFFAVEIRGMDAETIPITVTRFNAYGNGFEALDLTEIEAKDSDGRDISVTVDDNGLTAIWRCHAFEGTELKNLAMFYIMPTLNVGGEIVFSETVEFGTDILSGSTLSDGDNPSPAPSAKLPGGDTGYLLFANEQIIADAINNQNEHFLPTTNDYITYYDHIWFRENEIDSNELVDGLRFGIVSFDENGNFASMCEKFVFKTPELAELFAGSSNRYHDVEYGNLKWDGSTDVFCDRFPETEHFNSLPVDTTKQNLISVNIDGYAPRVIIEISKP